MITKEILLNNQLVPPGSSRNWAVMETILWTGLAAWESITPDVSTAPGTKLYLLFFAPWLVWYRIHAKMADVVRLTFANEFQDGILDKREVTRSATQSSIFYFIFSDNVYNECTQWARSSQTWNTFDTVIFISYLVINKPSINNQFNSYALWWVIHYWRVIRSTRENSTIYLINDG